MENDIDIEIENIIEEKYRNVKIEKNFVAYCLRKNHSPALSVNPEVFTQEYYKRIIETIQKKRVPMVKDTLKRALMKGVDEDEKDLYEKYINKLYKAKIKSLSQKKVEGFVEDLTEMYESRQVLNKTDELVSCVSGGDFDIKKAKKIMRDALAVDGKNTTHYQCEYYEGFQERLDYQNHIQENPEENVSIPIGIPQIDQNCNFQYGDVNYFLAPSGVGKTIALGNVGANSSLLNKNVLFVSLEMPVRDISHRIDSRMSRVSYKKFRDFELTNKDKKRWKKVIEKLREKELGYYEIMSSWRGLTTDKIEQHIDKIQNKHGKPLDILILDYINLMSPNKSSKDGSRDWKAQADIGWQIKELSQSLNSGRGCITHTATQVNDEANSKGKPGGITLNNTKYGRALSELAVNCYSIYTNAEYELENFMGCDILKSRRGVKREGLQLVKNYDIMVLSKDQLDIEREVLGIKKKES
jgi:hypothetical protein